MPQKLHDQRDNRADIVQALKTLIVALGDRDLPSGAGCDNITVENFFRILDFVIHPSQGTGKAPSNVMYMPTKGNSFNVVGTANEIRLIPTIGQQGGSMYIMDVKKGQTVKHMYATTPTSANRPMRLHTAGDWTAGRDTSILFWFDAEDNIWKVVGDALSDSIADLLNIICVAKSAKAYNLLVPDAMITGFEVDHFLGCTVSNTYGAASVEFSGNLDSIVISSTGVGCGISVYNSIGDLIHFFALDEAQISSHAVVDSVSKKSYLLTADETEKEVATQDNLFSFQSNGGTYRKDTDNPTEYMQLDYSIDKTKITIG